MRHAARQFRHAHHIGVVFRAPHDNCFIIANSHWSMPSHFINRNNMQRADGVRNPLLVNDHNELGMDGNEVPMRHPDFFAAGKLQRERLKAVLQPAFNPFNYHTREISPNTRKDNRIFDFLKRFIFVNFLPHPGPLPLGEGETLPASYDHQRLDWRTPHSKTEGKHSCSLSRWERVRVRESA
jgi:hypothetical protein